MNSIIDIPLIFCRVTEVDWSPDWRGQGAITGLDGNDQFAINRFPRWVGTMPMVLPPQMIGEWRAIMSRGRGVANLYRVRMIDPVTFETGRSGGWLADWSDYQAGYYVEPRPQVACAGAAPGATTITVDERTLESPIKVGSIMSYDDRPFLVEGRSGSGASTVLTVAMQRATIPAGGQIDCIARGIFRAADAASGRPSYDVSRVSTPTLSLTEWINR